MKNPLNLPKHLYDMAVPEPEKRWERSGQTGEHFVKYDESGDEINAPLFDVGVKQVEHLGTREFGDKRNPEGVVHTNLFTLNDGLQRLTQTWIPHDIRAAFTATSGMAYTTMIEGYDEDRAIRLAYMGIPNIQVSAEQGDKHWPGLMDIKRLGQTALLSPKISLAKTSQAETEIIAHLINELYGLPQLIEAHGDSRGGLTSLGRAVYSGLRGADGSQHYDITPLWIDPKAVVIHDRLPAGRFHEVITWLGQEALGSPPLVAELAVERSLMSLRGTSSANPNFWLASLVGIGPSLLGGETGELVKRMPDDTRGFVNGYKRDKLYDQEQWQTALRPYGNLYLNEVDRALHAYLLSLRGLHPQMARFGRLAIQSQMHGDDLAAYDVPHIVGRTLEQFAAQKQQLELAA